MKKTMEIMPKNTMIGFFKFEGGRAVFARTDFQK